jgi:hypothetical protein
MPRFEEVASIAPPPHLVAPSFSKRVVILVKAEIDAADTGPKFGGALVVPGD